MLAAIVKTMYVIVVCLVAYFFGGWIKWESFKTILLGIMLGLLVACLVSVFLFWNTELDLASFFFPCLAWVMFSSVALAKWWLCQKHSS